MRRVLIAAVIGVIRVAVIFIYLPLNKAPTTSTNEQVTQLSNKTSTNRNTDDLEAEGFEIINHTPAKLGPQSTG